MLGIGGESWFLTYRHVSLSWRALKTPLPKIPHLHLGDMAWLWWKLPAFLNSFFFFSAITVLWIYIHVDPTVGASAAHVCTIKFFNRSIYLDWCVQPVLPHAPVPTYKWQSDLNSLLLLIAERRNQRCFHPAALCRDLETGSSTHSVQNFAFMLFL